MINIFYAPEFRKRYHGFPLAVQRKAERREIIFRKNPFHPSLKTEKLEPRAKEYWSFRIDRSYRIIFRFSEEGRVVFLSCGHHNWIYRYPLSH